MRIFYIWAFLLRFAFAASPLSLSKSNLSISNTDTSLATDPIDTTVTANSTPKFPLLSIISPDILAHLTTFLFICDQNDPALRRLQNLVLKHPKVYYLLAQLSCSDYLPIPITECFGEFSLQEIVFLHQMAPEIRHAFFNRNLSQQETFISLRNRTCPNYYDNILIQKQDVSNNFLNVLNNLESRSVSMPKLCEFVEKYYPECLDKSFWDKTHTSATRGMKEKLSLVEIVASKYKCHSKFNSRAFETLRVDSKFPLLGLMLATTGEYEIIAPKIEEACSLIFDTFKYSLAILRAFLLADSGPFSDEDREAIKVRNVLLMDQFKNLLQYDTFILGNLLKFGSVFDIDSINPQDYIHFFTFNKYENHPVEIQTWKLLFLTVWRRPELSEAWRRLYERSAVKSRSDYFTAVFAPDSVINSDNLVDKDVARDIFSIRFLLPSTTHNSEMFIENFTKSVKNRAFDNRDIIPLYTVNSFIDNANYCHDAIKRCLVSKEKEERMVKPLVKAMMKSKNWTDFDFDFPDCPPLNHQFLRAKYPVNSSTDHDYFHLKYFNRFLHALFIDDQVVLGIVRAKSGAFSDFYKRVLRNIAVPVTFMGRFLKTWTHTSQSDLIFIFSRDSLFNQNIPINYENPHQKDLVKVLRDLHSETISDNSKREKNIKYYGAFDIHNMKFVELWYFYLEIDEEAFRKNCPTFEAHFHRIPDLKLQY